MLLIELHAAFQLLTRLPVDRFVGASTPPPLVAAMWAFPIVGATVGGLAALTYGFCAALGLPSAVGAIWALTAMVLVTGAFHEDGLADTADGFGGGRSPQERLTIMRDSRIGTFGAVALVLSLALRGAVVATIGQPWRVAAALIAGAAIGRAAMLLPILLLTPARTEGLAAEFRAHDARRALIGFAIALGIALLLLPFTIALRGILAACLCTAALIWLARRQIGGYTGDVLGAASVVAECAALSLFSI